MDKKGKIMIPGMYESVASLTDEEQKLYEKIEFDLDEYSKDVGADLPGLNCSHSDRSVWQHPKKLY